MDGTAVATYVGIAISGVLTVSAGAYRVVHNRISKVSQAHNEASKETNARISELKDKLNDKFVKKEDYHRDIRDIKDTQKVISDDIKKISHDMMAHWSKQDE